MSDDSDGGADDRKTNCLREFSSLVSYTSDVRITEPQMGRNQALLPRRHPDARTHTNRKHSLPFIFGTKRTEVLLLYVYGESPKNY